MKKLLVLAIALLISTALAADVSLFAERQSMHLTSPKVYSDDLYIEGYESYKNELGIEYKPSRLSYRLSFIDASSGDNGRNEYNHQGVTFGIKYCLAYCE